MKKIIGILSAFLLPVVSFAQGYMNYFDRGYGYYGFDTNQSIWGLFLLALVPLIWFCLFAIIFIFWIVMLVDALRNAPKDMKLIWVIVLIFTHIIGALIYYFVEKRPRNKVKLEKTEHKTEEKKEEK